MHMEMSIAILQSETPCSPPSSYAPGWIVNIHWDIIQLLGYQSSANFAINYQSF